MKIVTVRQPWAWLIVATGAGGKDVENRGYATTHRGPVLIQAGMRRDPNFEAALDYARERGIEVPVDQLRYGGIVGRAHIVSCTRNSASRWFTGPVGWVLTDRGELPFVPVTGRLTLFDAPRDVLAKLGLEFIGPAQYCFNPNI